MFKSASLPKIIFICGGNNHSKRDQLISYIMRHGVNDRIVTCKAENAWNIIVEQKLTKTSNALEFENELADLSDCIIIIVESAGSIAELGAFSNSDSLRKKLLPILDKQYEKDISFVNTGPVKWVNKDSKYQPSLYIDFNCLLTHGDEILERVRNSSLRGIRPSKRYSNRHLTLKELLFLSSM
ncbi:retron St85 family effector protein [Piscirickettsia litoralis]|uniref:Uncharacterized protein n=1 Tax=Piscirickettsia litoralis TaxID=1891921 RepID=A0ABX2ZYE5_9GAMM|nr:retron St85 family effector protein [Piscirickettsia litoralis]ODN41597.1 hypothetical protein BGC07_15980 [Piscirickettsia litoralis]